MSISVAIFTHNDEANLPACLESVAWSDDVVVFDAGSSDRTTEIARQRGAAVVASTSREDVFKREFKHPWLHVPGADDVTTARLRDEMRAAVTDPKHAEAAYAVRPRVMFLGKWIKHSSLYPTWSLRLFRRDQLVIDSTGQLSTSGPAGHLRSYFDQHPFNKGLPWWWEQQNRASSREARELVEMPQDAATDWKSLLSPNGDRRRKAIKHLTLRLPLRSTLVFLYLMVARRGVFDGPAGWTYCRMRARYEFLVAAKVNELRRLQQGLPPG